RVVEAIEVDTPNYDSELLNLKTREQMEAGTGGETGEKLRERDPLYEQAVEIVIREQRGSTSLLQRALGIGYGKASRFIDYMAEDGIVGAFNGSNARQVLVTPEEWDGRKKVAAGRPRSQGSALKLALRTSWADGYLLAIRPRLHG